MLDSPVHLSFKKIHIKPSPCCNCIELSIKHYLCRLKVITLCLILANVLLPRWDFNLGLSTSKGSTKGYHLQNFYCMFG